MLGLALFVAACVRIPAADGADRQPRPTQWVATPATSPVPVTAATDCAPTFGDPPSPTYRPDTPVRSSVGRGHVVTGTIRSSRGCAPIPGAKLELWPDVGGDHPAASRATVYTDEEGRYRFECDPADHIHMRASAPGYVAIFTNRYHTEGKAEGIFDIVLAPAAQ